MKNQDKRRHRSQHDDGAPMGYRHARLQELIGAELASLLRDEVADPVLEDVRLTQCELSVDYANVRAWYTITGPPSRASRHAAEAALERANGFIRRRLAEAVEMKQTPNLRFIHDDVAIGLPGEEKP
jgi:ribosome-binding factor A